MPSVSVIILNWNGVDVLPRCLDALTAQTFKDYEIIVVDNGSSDSSTDYIEARWPGLKVVKLDRNYGFAKANNIGTQKAQGEWLAFVNNDAFPAPDWLARLMSATKKHPLFAIFASCIVQYENRDLLDGTGDVHHISGVVWHRQHNHPVSEARDIPEEVFSPSGAAALYSRRAFWQVGGFDEDFFSYHEDVDLGFRLRLQGHRCLYIPDAVVFHVGSASLGKRSDFSVLHGHRNMVWSYFQNMPASLFWKYLPAHLMANFFFLLYLTRHGQGKAIWRAKWDALRGIPTALRKRRHVQLTRTVETSDILRVLDRRFLSPYQFRKRRLKRKVPA